MALLPIPNFTEGSFAIPPWLKLAAAAINGLLGASSPPPATLTALKAIAAADRSSGMTAVVQADGATWRYASASTLTGDDFLVVTPAGSPATGRWLRLDRTVDLKLPVIFSAADGAVLYTVPPGFRLRPLVPFWEITTAFTTGATGKAGISTSNAAGSTNGDLLGGASLDAAASLTLNLIGGTSGDKISTVTPGLVLVGGDTLKWNKSSTFTAGAGFAHVLVSVLLAPAA